jgi:hypothetical protein
VGFCFFSHFAPVITAQQNWDNHTRYLMSLPSFLFGRFVRLFLFCFWVFLVCAAVGVILLVIFALQRGSFKEEFKLQPGLPHNNFTCVCVWYSRGLLLIGMFFSHPIGLAGSPSKHKV